MSVPSTRNEFKEYVLRALGKPVIQINVSDEQVDDRVDEALSYYADYHFDGSEKIYYKHQITTDDKTNKYITLPENILGAVSIFDIGSALGSGDMFNIQYQIALNDLYTLTSQSLVPYVMAMSHIQFLQQILVGKKPIRYNRHRDQLFIDMNWDSVTVGEYLIVEAYQVVDPEQFADVWKDRWLAKYTVALVKRQWGNNLKKYSGIQMPGGVTFNGQRLYEEADEEIKRLEKEMVGSYSIPVTDMIGSIALFLICGLGVLI